MGNPAEKLSLTDGKDSENVRVASDGSVSMFPNGAIRTTCQIDVRYFPFDEQNCSIMFGKHKYNFLFNFELYYIHNN